VTDGELRRKGVETFLPSIKRLSRWKDRSKLVDFPLFPGYLFVHLPPGPEKVLDILRTRGVVTFVSLVPGCPTPVSSDEIGSLRLLIESGQEFDIYPQLKKGARVRVKSGPLKGAVGAIASKEGQSLFVVNIDILGRSIGVRIYSDDISAE
jgi:transcription antitermination factor NusG